MSRSSRAQGARTHIQKTLAVRGIHNPSSYWRLVHSIRHSTTLLSTEHASRWPGDARCISVLCCHLARYQDAWVREPETWSPPAEGATGQLYDLVRHLLNTWPVPCHMIKHWLDDSTHQFMLELYLSLARGQSIRKTNFLAGVSLNKSEARHFMSAPHDATLSQAIRYSKARATGIELRLAVTLMRSLPPICDDRSETIWIEMFRFFARHQPIARDEAKQIAQFVFDFGIRPTHEMVPDSQATSPLIDDLRLKQRTVRSIRRLIIESEQDVRQRSIAWKSRRSSFWKPLGIASFLRHTRESKWTIDELLTVDELRHEGANMKHCVYEYYTSACLRGRSSIWSLRLSQPGKNLRRLATIEINPSTKRIIQVQAKYNSDPTSESMEMIRVWAANGQLNW